MWNGLRPVCNHLQQAKELSIQMCILQAIINSKAEYSAHNLHFNGHSCKWKENSIISASFDALNQIIFVAEIRSSLELVGIYMQHVVLIN